MALTKKRIAEDAAVLLVTMRAMERAQSEWPRIRKTLRRDFNEVFGSWDDRLAAYDLALAAIAWDMQSLENLFDSDQASRLRQRTCNVMRQDQNGEYVLAEIEDYRAAFARALGSSEPQDSIFAIPARLLWRWLGPDYERLTTEVGLHRLLLLPFVTEVVLHVAGAWKILRDECELTPANFPLDYQFGSSSTSEFQVTCWNCKCPLEVTARNRGTKVRCPECGTRQHLPK